MSEIRVGIKITGDGVSAERAISNVETKLKTLSTSANKASRDISAGFNLMRNALAGAAAAISVRELSRVVDSYSGLQARLRLVSGSTDELTRAQRELFAMAQRNMASLADTTQLYTKLAAAVREMGGSQENALLMTNIIGQSLRISGESAESSAAAIQQLGQALNQGVLRGEEFNSVMQQAPRLARALADGLGVPIGALRKMADAGELTADRVVNAILSQSDAISREYARMPQTISGALTQIENAWTRYIGETDQANGTSRQFAETLGLIARNFDEIVGPLATTVGWIARVEVGGWLEFQEILGRIVATLREMIGLQGPGSAPDAETARLMRMGRGQMTIEEIAGPPPQAQQAQERYFDGIRRGAEAATEALRGLSEEQQRVANLVIEQARAAKVDPALALAVAKTESRFRQSARSPVGALGVMQLMPATARGLGVNPNDERQNVEGGIKYIKQLGAEFKSLTQIAAAYNAGPGNVRNNRWLNFRETRDYVQKVAAAYQEFQGLLNQTDGFNVAREQFDLLRDSTQRYLADQDERIKTAQRAADATVAQLDAQRAGLEREKEAFDRAQQDKIKAAQGSYDAQMALETERAAKLQAFAEQDLALVRQQYDARQKAMEAERAAYQTALGNPNLQDDQQRRTREALADVNADLVRLANERAEAEAKAGQAALDNNRGGLELAQKQREFIAGINADLAFQKQLYQQLAAAKTAGVSAEGLGLLRGTAEQTRQLPGVVSADDINRLDNVIAQTKIYEQAIADLAQTEQDRMQDVREQQLRENAYWDQLMGRTESLANLWTDIYGAQAAGLSNLTVAMARYSKDVEQIQQRWNDPNTKKQWGDMSGLMEGLQQAQAGAVALSETMLAIRSTTQQGTKAYEDLTTAAGNFAIIGQWLNVVEGIGAVIHQLRDGDVYTAIPRALGVAAMVASMGVQTGVIGGAGTQNATAKYSDGSNNGVFGDSTAASESITKSLEIIRDNSSNDLNYSAAMLRALEGIEAAMGGVTNTIIRGVRPASVNTGRLSGLGDLDAGGIDPLGRMIGNLIFSTYRRISDFGIQASQQALSAIIKGGFSGQVYTDIETTTKVLGMTMSKSVKTAFEGLDPAIAKQFTLAFKSIAEAVREAGKAFGLTAEDFTQRMRGFIVDIGKISTKDMTGEELQKKITQMFSEQSDRMARRFMPGLGKFQQVGEGYFQTFVRVAEAVNRAGGELERLGIKAISYRNIERKQADVAAEIVRESLLQQTNLTAGVRQYVAELTGSAEDLIDAYKKLKEATQGLRTAGLGTNVTRAEINAGGGLDAYTQNLQTYLDKFLTPSERLIGGWQNMGDAFTALGLKMPTTNAEFRKMVEGIDTSTEAGQKLRGAVLALAPGFADLTSAMDDAKSALQSAYDTAKQQAQGLRDYLNSLKTGDMAAGTPMDRYNAAKKIYQETLAKAQAGDPKAIAALQGVSSTFLELSKKYFAASGQYGADLASVQTGLGSVADSIEKQVKTAEDQYTWLKDNTNALTGLADAMKKWEITLAKVNGIQSSQTGQSVNDANAANTDASVKEKEAKSYEDQLAKLMRGVRQAYAQGQTKKAKELRDEIERYIAEIQASGIYSVAWDGKRHDVSYRAMGGYTPPGWAVVGERGAELVNFTRPSRVYTAVETRAALSDSPALLDRIENAAKASIKVDQAGYQALLAELQAIRAEMAEQTRAQKMAAAA